MLRIANTKITKKNNKVDTKKLRSCSWGISIYVLTAKIDASPTIKPEMVLRVFLLNLDLFLAKRISNYLVIIVLGLIAKADFHQ